MTTSALHLKPAGCKRRVGLRMGNITRARLKKDGETPNEQRHEARHEVCGTLVRAIKGGLCGVIRSTASGVCAYK